MPPSFGKVVAYTYSDPLLESVPDLAIGDWQIDRLYQDWGSRQQLQQLLQDFRTESADYLLVRRLADLGDSLDAIATCLTELNSLNLEVVVLQDQGLHPVPSKPSPDWIDLFQSLQSDQRSQQLQRGHARNRLKALPPPGKAPYGYRRGKDRYIVDRSTAPVVKEFFDHFLLYGSLRGSVRHLHKKYSKKISVSTGKRWLTSPVYRGDLEYQTGEVIQNTHVPILSREEAAQIDRLLRRNRRMPSRTASAPRSLSGLVVCAACESSMKISRVTGKEREYLYLRPAKCPKQSSCGSLAYEAVLERTIQQICRELPPAVNQATIPDVDQFKQSIKAQLSDKQAILDELPLLQSRGILDTETADLRAYKVRTEMAQLQTQIAQLPPVNLKTIAQVVSIPQFWLDLSESERRFYFREFIQQIQILWQDEDWQIQLNFIF